tara:strand:+ start:110 stop:703 length:594 start_codon:yes stop_codon:yes gene_type:complete
MSSNSIKVINHWNFSVGKGSESVEHNIKFKGCIFESEKTMIFITKDCNSDEIITNSIEKDSEKSNIIKNEMYKIFAEFYKRESEELDLSLKTVAYSCTGAARGEGPGYSDEEASFSTETDSAYFNEVYGDCFDEDTKIMLAFSWTYELPERINFENVLENSEIYQISSELLNSRRSKRLNDEIKAKCDYNDMVFFEI